MPTSAVPEPDPGAVADCFTTERCKKINQTHQNLQNYTAI